VRRVCSFPMARETRFCPLIVVAGASSPSSNGYDVTFQEFDGPHGVPADIARRAIEWFLK